MKIFRAGKCDIPLTNRVSLPVKPGSAAVARGEEHSAASPLLIILPPSNLHDKHPSLETRGERLKSKTC